ncbi:MAG: alpha/beta hydrolase [Bacteroidales bacterium]|nr:alpha/beta hydrolase [Bacteroidales bacterium]
MEFNNINIRYREKGKGKTIVLLHGYLESLDVWEDFSNELSKNFRVISIDLLGHGQSGIYDETHTMEIMAEFVNFILNKLNVDKCFLVGHSMGGYVTLAFADKYPEKLISFSLFHSSPFADNDEKMANRKREIELIKQGKKQQLININIPKTFADSNLNLFKNEIEKNKSIAANTPDNGIIATLKGMALRTDKQHVLKNSKVPILLIIGKKDNYIPFEVGIKIAGISNSIKPVVFENSGHMGFIEEKDKAVKIISEFVNS